MCEGKREKKGNEGYVGGTRRYLDARLSIGILSYRQWESRSRKARNKKQEILTSLAVYSGTFYFFK